MSSASRHKSQFEVISTRLRAALDQVAVPRELQDALLLAVENMSTRYAQNDLRPSELNAGDFIEACVRILQFVGTGSFTPLHRTLPSMPDWLRTMENTTVDDSLRINIPKLIDAMYAVRNRRGVSHIAGKVTANKPDAMLVLTNTRWILAEFVRIFHNIADHEEAQRAVDLLAMNETPVIENFEGIRRVITAKSEPVTNQMLVLLLTSAEGELSKSDLVESIRSTPSNFKVAIKRLEGKNYVHVYNDERVKITVLGRTAAAKILHDLASR